MRKLLYALFALGLALAPASAQNYNATAGAGLVFGSKFVGSVNYPQWVLCDPTTPANCATIKPASTAPLATDLAAVTAESPNSQLSTATGAAGAGHSCATATPATVVGCLGQIDDDVKGPIPAGTNLIGNVGTGVYPAGATAITASATGTTTATTATLAANATLHTYICGFSIRANATGAATNNATVTGTVTATMNYTQWTAPLASGLGVTEQIFSPCIISSATNTAIAVVSGAPGSGGVVSVTAWGFQL